MKMKFIKKIPMDYHYDIIQYENDGIIYECSVVEWEKIQLEEKLVQDYNVPKDIISKYENVVKDICNDNY